MSDVTLYSGTVGLAAGVTRLTSEEFDLGGYTAADTFNLFKLPAGVVVLGAFIEITESAGETCTVDVGITGTDVDEFIDGVNMNQVAGTLAYQAVGDGITGCVPYTSSIVVTLLTVTGSTYAAGKGKLHMLVGKA